MAYMHEEVKDFSKGTVTVVEDHAISRGAASYTRNFINVGDGFELVPGTILVGDEVVTSTPVVGLGAFQGLDGIDYVYRIRATNLEYFDPSSETWTIVKSDLTSGVDTGMFGIQTPAGSFVVITSPSDGPLRINLANPTSIVDLYDAARNYRGILPIYNNRAFVVQRTGYPTTLYVSYIDADFPYTAISNENIGTGDGVTVTFNDTLSQPLVAGRTINVTAGAVTGTDNGLGVISGTGIAGTINYTTGAISVTFTAAPAGAVAIECDYSYESPKTDGLLDFTFSTPRTAGQGDVVYQFDGSDPIQFVIYFKEVHYVFHKRSIWTIKFSADDTAIENLVFRNNTGVAHWRQIIQSNEGLAYADQTDNDKPVLRFLRYSEIADTTIPEEISVNVDLTGYDFRHGASVEWQDFWIWTCASPGSETVDTMVLYNKRWKTIDFAYGPYNSFARGQQKLYAGSSVSPNVFELFSGYDLDGADVIGEWEGKDDDLDEYELKKCKKFVLETAMANTQKIRVEASFDEADFVTIGTIIGSTDPSQGEFQTMYGALLYGSAYDGTPSADVYRFMKEFRFGRAKFMRVKIRFVAYGSGYARVKIYTFKDIRKKGYKLPQRFR